MAWHKDKRAYTTEDVAESYRVLIVESDLAVVAAIEHALKKNFDTLVAINSFSPAVIDPETRNQGIEWHLSP